MSDYDVGALLNVFPGLIYMLWFLCKLDWRSMLLCTVLLFFAVFWYHLYPTYLSHLSPHTMIALNITAALGVVSQLFPLPYSAAQR